MNSINSFQDILQPGMEAGVIKLRDHWLTLSVAATLALVLCLLGYRKYRELELRCNRELEINAQLTNRNIELQLHRRPSDGDANSLL